jgi:hypothetical protein
MSDDAERPADPFRAQLDARWAAYLATGERADDHDGWLQAAFASYRDEIVHFGAQLLNDCTGQPWDAAVARRTFADYRAEAQRYDADPEKWEAAFWGRLRDQAPELYARFDGKMT